MVEKIIRENQFDLDNGYLIRALVENAAKKALFPNVLKTARR